MNKLMGGLQRLLSEMAFYFHQPSLSLATCSYMYCNGNVKLRREAEGAGRTDFKAVHVPVMCKVVVPCSHQSEL